LNKKISVVLSLLSTLLSAYEPGHGAKLAEALTVGGYVSLEHENSKNTNESLVEDVAVLAYGSLNSSTRYMLELENSGPYTIDHKNNTEHYNVDFKVERAFVDYKNSANLNIMAGKFISPIGYWNQTPIVVLRDTTSSPLISTNTTPKLLTGLQVYGETPVENIEYELAFQGTKGIDDGYNNFELTSFAGGGIKISTESEVESRVFVGSFTQKSDDTRRTFINIASKADIGQFQLLAEGVYSSINPKSSSHTSVNGAFLQTRYKLSNEHYLVGRAEHYFDGFEKEKENIAIIGYNYRPLFPVSIKVEYQFNSISEKSKLLCSISALF
jgi:hypothetical protein